MPKSASSKKKSSRDFVFYKAPHIEEENVVKTRHTMFATNTSGGRLSQRSIMLKTKIASARTSDHPAEDTHLDPVNASGVLGSTLPEINSEPLDIDYIGYLEEMGANMKGRRVRAQGVSYVTLQIMSPKSCG